MKKKIMDLIQLKEHFLNCQTIKGLSPRTIGMNSECIDYYLQFSNEYSEKAFNEFLYMIVNKQLSLATKNKIIGHLRVFFYWLMDNGYIKPFKIHLIKGQEPKIKFFTEDEIDLLMTHPYDNYFSYDRMYTIICFILGTGARANTILNLKVEDLDFKEKTVTFTHLKNKKSVILPMSNSLCRVLNNYLNKWDIKEYVFPDCYNNQLTLNSLSHSMRYYCNKCGVKPRGVHSLRHAFRRMYIKNGGDRFSLSKFLTHSSIEMTQRYVSLFTQDLNLNYVPLEHCVKNTRIKRSF